MMKNNNKNIKFIKTNKYKDINLYLRFSVENKNNLLEKICLLTKLVGDVSIKYPTKLEMATYRDMLYGINCDCSFKTSENIVTFSIHYSFINPRFVDCSIDEYNMFIKETLYNSIIDEKTLNEAKTTIVASLRREIDKPANFSTEKFIEIVSKDNPDFLINSRGEDFIKILENIKLEELKEAYKYILNKAKLNVYLCGDLDDSDASKLLNYRFDNRKDVSYKLHRCQYPKKKTMIDKKDISQTYLSIVYSTPYNRNHKDYFAWVMGNYLLGLGPTSLLFSEIREKMSLCYSISSRCYKGTGLVRIATYIDGKNKDIAIKEIMKQVDRLAKKDYEQNRLDVTKAYILDTFQSIYDDLDSLIDFYFENDLHGLDVSIEDYCDKLKKVTVDDISRVYSKYSPYFNHVLLGK